jgi:Glycosyl hydrolase family 76
VVFALAIAAALFFGSGGAALNIGSPPPRHVVVTVPIPRVKGPVTLNEAAANATAELVGSGDKSSIQWLANWGLWGNHNAAPGARVNWGSPYWWQSALDLRALVRYLEQTHNSNPIYQQVIDETFERNINRPGTPVPANFGNEFMDDTVWWGLAWLEAARYELNDRHDLTDATRFMRVAEWDANRAWSSPRTCRSQGITWKLGTPPDTVTNAEFIALAAELAQAQEHPGPWFDKATAIKWKTEAWQILWWLENTRLINVRTGHVWDGLDAQCYDSGGALTYTEGETADALVQMGLATGWRKDIVEAKRFIAYALSPKSNMTYRGVLQEPCEATATHCRNATLLADSTVWKGIFIDAVADWRAATRSREYDAFLIKQAQAIIDNSASDGARETTCQTPHDCQLGFFWSRRMPPNDVVPPGPGSQESALSALTDALSVSSS